MSSSPPLSQRLFGIGFKPTLPLTVGEMLLQLREQTGQGETRVIVAQPDDTAADAYRLFKSFDLHHLPVVSGVHVIGLVSSTDLLNFFAERDGADPAQTPLSEVMTANPVTIAESAPLSELVKTLSNAPFRCLPVLNPTDEIWDIVTSRDLVRFMNLFTR